MDYRTIKNCTQRQFDAVLKREGITVRDYFDDTEYLVFFRKNNRGTNPQGKVRMFYPQNCGIKLGTAFTLKNDTYIVISQDAQESDIYYTSIAVKCDTSFTIETNEGWITLPFVTESDKYGVSSGSVFTMIDGSVICYTSLNKYSKDIAVNDIFYNYGGRYSVANYFCNNNIHYFYMKRELNTDASYSLVYEGDTVFDISTTPTYQLSFIALNNMSAVDNPKLKYVSSDETVATVDENGLVTFLAEGTVSITATWKEDGEENGITCTVELTVGDSSVVIPTMTAQIYASSDTVKVGGSYKTIKMMFYDADGNDITTDTIANLTADDFDWTYTIDGVDYETNTDVLTILAGTTVNATKVKFANNRTYLEKILVIGCTCATLGLSASKDFNLLV